MVKRAWEKEQAGSRMYKVTKKVKDCKIAMLEWNKKEKRNSKVRIQDLKEQLAVVKVRNEPHKRGKIVELKTKLSKAYKDEELY